MPRANQSREVDRDAARLRSRGVHHNPANRYQSENIEWDDPVPRYAETTLTRQKAGTILAKNTSPDVPFDQSINPYRGCEHGCVYCFARPTHAWLDLSPGQDFETRLFAKSNAAERLRATLERPSYECKVIGLGTNTDPYQQVEQDEKLTRQILQVCLEYRNPVSIVTKSHLILRDLDILAEMAEYNLVSAALSVTTLSRDLKRIMEPRAPGAAARLAAIRGLSDAGIPTAVLFAPVIPRINDEELEQIVERAADCGATDAGFVMLRLPLEVREIFESWLGKHFPQRAAAVMNAMRGMHGGREYRSNFGTRQRGQGALAEMIAARFAAACRRAGLRPRKASLDTSAFRRQCEQMQLFG